MSTVSTCAPSARLNKNLIVPSLLFSVATMLGQVMCAHWFNFSRVALDTLVMLSKSLAIFCQSHCHTCTARKLGSSSSSIKALSLGRVMFNMSIIGQCNYSCVRTILAHIFLGIIFNKGYGIINIFYFTSNLSL